MFSSDISLEGKIDGNRHLGHILLECLRKRKPDDICQIDAATGEEETYGSVLARSVAMARSLRRAGLRPGDVMALGGRNHLNLRIPYYAALMHGLPVAGIDPGFKYGEIKSALEVLHPTIAFCEYENYEYYSRAVKELGLDTKIVTFFDGKCSMAKFVEQYDDKESEEYKPSYFDTDEVYAWLLSTSGTTGVVKYTAIKHGAAVHGVHFLMKLGLGGTMVENGRKIGFNLSPVQWITSYLNATAFPLTNTILLQTSKKAETECYIDIINKHKPSTIICSPSFISLILKHEKTCDLTCLDVIAVSGAVLYKETLLQLKARVRKDTRVCQVYGSSETLSIVATKDNTPVGSVGTNYEENQTQLKLVDTTTGAEVTDPYKHGEMWVKGPSCFTKYYNNPEETAASITEDGWFKTGDILYRDERGNYYFVDRLKMLIKYRSTHVIPPEVEEVIMGHPGVVEVCVTGVPHAADGERPAACVVRRARAALTAQEISDLVASKLSDAKQLRGGVIFVDSLPKTSTGKVIRPRVKSLVMELLARETE